MDEGESTKPMWTLPWARFKAQVGSKNLLNSPLVALMSSLEKLVTTSTIVSQENERVDGAVWREFIFWYPMFWMIGEQDSTLGWWFERGHLIAGEVETFDSRQSFEKVSRRASWIQNNQKRPTQLTLLIFSCKSLLESTWNDDPKNHDDKLWVCELTKLSRVKRRRSELFRNPEVEAQAGITEFSFHVKGEDIL